ncbi:hypothetical protein RAS1_34320 [Phycisphaerae bacterium RAS1]|nr:hypothetical protein RAS1_34320 [Phycisphaerae bacterium RAS1]
MFRIEPDNDFTVRKLVDLHREGFITVNPEYQRGEVWKTAQKKRLIDSILRGYPLPFFFLHDIECSQAGMKREGFEVIDGQQRINAGV